MKLWIALMTLLVVTACGSDDSKEETVGKEIADDYQQAMDEAAAVEQQLQEQKERMDEAIDEPR
jgi:RNA 3'-terminal phosphate cyclase